MKKKFVTNLALLLFVNLLVKPFWIFGIDRTVQNLVGSAEYGFYFSLLSFSFLLNIVLDLGITQYNNRNVARHPALVSRFFSQIFFIRIILGVVYILVSYLLAFGLGYSGRQLWILAFLVVNQFLVAWILYLRSNLSGLLYLREDSLLSVLDRLLMILICGVLLWGNVTGSDFRIEWFVYAQTTAYLLSSFIIFLLVTGKIDFFRPVFRLKHTLVILRQSFPYALLVLVMSFYYRVDTVMLERMLQDGKWHAGIYAQAFRILDAVSMFAFLYGALLLPIFSRMLRQKQPVDDLLRLSFLALLVPSLGLVFAGIPYKEEIMDLLYRENTESSGRILGLLLFSFLGISASYIFGTLLTANGNLRQLVFIALGGAILNVALNLFLIPGMQESGAALASMATQGSVAIAQVVLARIVFGLRMNTVLLARGALFIVVMTAVSVAVEALVNEWILGFFLIFFSGFFSAWLTRLVKAREFFHILREEEDTPQV